MNHISKKRLHRRFTVLAIDPGTRQIGIAVLDGRELVYHGVKTLRSHGSPQERLQEARRVVLRLIRDFRPQVLAVEHAFYSRSRNAALLNVLVEEIRTLARQKGI